MRTPRRLTDAEREQRRERDRQRLKQAAEQLLGSEGWQRWVRTRASNGLARYSLTNQLLVALQSDGRARFVAGFKQWLALGYGVTRGSRALRIMAPMPVKERDHQTGQETGETITLFRAVPVFDRLSRVRSGGCHRTPSREALPLGLPACVARPRAGAKAKATAMACAVVAEPAPGGRRRSGDRARPPGTPENRRAVKGTSEFGTYP